MRETMAHTILIVDDSNLARRNLRSQLEPLGLEVIEAANGEDALKLAAERKIDLIVTDIGMPGMDGIEFCSILKKDRDLRRIPIVIASSFDSEIEIEKGFQAGASDYIRKADVREQLAPTVRRLLETADFRKRLRILVVDDSVTIRKLVQARLEQAGYEILTATNGREALATAEATAPDLILSDLQMPVMDGFALCAAWRADPRFNAIPFVGMSTMSDRSAMHRLLRHGAVGFIAKPFNLDQLVILLDKLLTDQFLLLLKEKERLDLERDAMVRTITSLVAALEARDSYTHGHSESVATIAGALGALAGLPAEELETLRLGARLHDIGKIGIRDRVLLKPGKLDEEEFRHVKEHPAIGAEILGPIQSLAPIIPIVRHHHERWNGTGYPDGLAGEAIPLHARIVAVADVFDALTSDRPYRDGMHLDEATGIIANKRESHFCPWCVDLFFEWIAMPEQQARKNR
jgi:response regulator RpfG family c-di-GMP phosphodiesterase